MLNSKLLFIGFWGIALILAVALFPSENGAEEGKKYEPTWESIKQHKLPKWYDDAKLGIFIHWGLYSVPGWAPPTGELGKVDWNQWFKNNPYAEWYLNTMKIKDSPTWKYHVKTYGESFSYLDFIPVFNREVKKWNPDDWAKLFQEVGARYVVLTTKHHDGFTLWPSRVRNPHRKQDQQGSQRDLVGELTKAVRARSIKMGLYYSGGLDWSFYDPPITRQGEVQSTVQQSEEFARYVDAHWRELIERYHPDILWNDISYPKKGDVLGIFSEYYNKFPEGVINNRWGMDFADITTPEYETYEQATPKKWESCRGIGFSFGYNRAEGPEHMLSVDKLVDMFVDVVSKNGNLLLDVGPEADGTITELQVERLRGLGQWLSTNGEAIFGTRPWVRAEGKTVDGTEVRFTRKGESVYAVLLDKPKSSSLTIESLLADEKTAVQLLGAKGDLRWSQNGRDLTVTLPANLVDSPAYALKITPKPWKLVRE
jgi:alpha-L-fucosidase